MSLKDTLNNFFSENPISAECFMRGYADRISQDFVESIDASYNEVDAYGGEDCGSTYYRVYCFQSKGKKIYVKFNGWYASHYGTEYQNFEFVTPQQRTITVYE